MRSNDRINIRERAFIGKWDKVLFFAAALIYSLHTFLHFLPISDGGGYNAGELAFQHRDTWFSLCDAPLFWLLFMPSLLCIAGSFVWLIIHCQKHGAINAITLCKALGAAMLGMLWQLAIGGFIAIIIFHDSEDAWTLPTIWCYLFFLVGTLAILLSYFARRRLKKTNFDSIKGEIR